MHVSIVIADWSGLVRGRHHLAKLDLVETHLVREFDENLETVAVRFTELDQILYIDDDVILSRSWYLDLLRLHELDDASHDFFRFQGTKPHCDVLPSFLVVANGDCFGGAVEGTNLVGISRNFDSRNYVVIWS